jgi:hypothetical protein
MTPVDADDSENPSLARGSVADISRAGHLPLSEVDRRRSLGPR